MYAQFMFMEKDQEQVKKDAALPLVCRFAGYNPRQYDLYVFIVYAKDSKDGKYELYRIKDFVRQGLNVAPIVYALEQSLGVNAEDMLVRISKQIKFLGLPENADLPFASAQLINSQFNL